MQEGGIKRHASAVSEAGDVFFPFFLLELVITDEEICSNEVIKWLHAEEAQRLHCLPARNISSKQHSPKNKQNSK
jgi:hypothetical protein